MRYLLAFIAVIGLIACESHQAFVESVADDVPSGVEEHLADQGITGATCHLVGPTLAETDENEYKGFVECSVDDQKERIKVIVNKDGQGGFLWETE